MQRYILYTYYTNILTIFNTHPLCVCGAVLGRIERHQPSARSEERATSERGTSEEVANAVGGQPSAVSPQPQPSAVAVSRGGSRRRSGRPSRTLCPPSASCLRSGVARRRVWCPVVPVASPAPRCSPLRLSFLRLARALFPPCGVASAKRSRPFSARRLGAGSS